MKTSNFAASPAPNGLAPIPCLSRPHCRATAGPDGRRRVRRRVSPLVFLTAALVAVVLASSGDAAAQAGNGHCSGRSYAFDGRALIPGGGAPDTLRIDASGVSTASGCPATAPKTFLVKPNGRDKLVVRWSSCGGVPVRLRATISADCSVLRGSVKVGRSAERFVTAQAVDPTGLPTDPNEAWDPSLMPLPLDAEIVSAEEFLAASAEPGFRLVSPGAMDEDDALAERTDAENRRTIEEFVALYPERSDLLSIGVDPNDPDLVSSGDGNYLLTIRDADGNESTVQTMGAEFQRAVRAGAIRDFASPENQLALYMQRYESALQTLPLLLPTPGELDAWSTEDLTALNEEITRQYPTAEANAPITGESLPASYPSRCSNEIGAGDGTDGSNYCRHATEGLWNTATWPLKYFDSCVKAQANRGSCVSFAISAGRELRIARKYDRWVNLSEQALFYAAKQSYQPRWYGDGLDGSSLLQQIFDTNYAQPLEQTWDYNPALSRIANNVTATYTNSCVGYNSAESLFCSDTAGQGRLVCTPAPPPLQTVFLCGSLPAPTTGITVRSLDPAVELWDATNPDNGVSNLLYSVYVNESPVVLGFDVVRSFDSPDANGFVPYDAASAKVCSSDAAGNCMPNPDCQCSRGGHAALAVGYISNLKLPEGTASGSGGGYLIVKNSWGCVADGGYYYLPIDWVRRFVYSARGVGDVETSGPLPAQPIDDFRFDYKPVPPTIRVVQPILGERYVEGQEIPLVADGADFQYDKYALLGDTRWTSNLQGPIGTGTSTRATLVRGTHQLTVTYTGRLGVVVRASTSVQVGPRPVNLPPSPRFDSVYLGTGTEECGTYCAYNCVLATGYGSDPEDGLLRAPDSVRWYSQAPSRPRTLVATGSSKISPAGIIKPKFLGCIRPCGGTFTFTLEVQDSAGQRAEARRQLGFPGCVN
jgi:hypothetical protein